MLFYKELLIGLALVIILFVLEFLSIPFVHYYLGVSILFAFCFTKLAYIVLKCFKTIVRISHKDVPYHKFLIFVALNVLLLVFSFSLDYFYLYKLQPDTFSGLEDVQTNIQAYFKLFYLSLLLFTNMGVANVVPVKIPAEALVMFEAIISFVTLIFILSDYVTLRESLVRLKKPRYDHWKRRRAKREIPKNQ